MRNGSVRARARYRDLDGVTRPVSRFGATKAAAQRELLTALRDRRGAYGGRITPETKLGEVIDKWSAEIAESDRAVSTIETWERVAEKRLRPSLGELRLYELTVPTIEASVAAVAEHHGHGAARTYKTVLSSVMAVAVRVGATETNPVANTSRLTSPRGYKRRPRALSDAEARTIIDGLEVAAESGDYGDVALRDLVLFMLGTGARIGEALALRFDYIDLGAGTVEIAATTTEKSGHGTVIAERTKSEAGWRVLALPASVMAMLKRRRGMIWPHNDEGLVFPTVLGHTWARDKASKALRAALDPLGFQWVTSHTFRKTVATRLDAAGLSARQVADQLGHASPSMTADVYMGRGVVSAGAASLLETPAGDR